MVAYTLPPKYMPVYDVICQHILLPISICRHMTSICSQRPARYMAVYDRHMMVYDGHMRVYELLLQVIHAAVLGIRPVILVIYAGFSVYDLL